MVTQGVVLRVLAVEIRARKFGFVVLEGSDILLDCWNTVPSIKNLRCAGSQGDSTQRTVRAGDYAFRKADRIGRIS
jgi:hypothetical protein